jgi:hypothetical protein
MDNPYNEILSYAINNRLGVVVPGYVDYLRIRNHLKLFPVLSTSINIITYVGYKSMIAKTKDNRFVCLVYGDDDSSMNDYNFYKYVRVTSLPSSSSSLSTNNKLTEYELNFIRGSYKLNDIVNTVLPLQLSLAEAKAKTKLDGQSLAFISCLGLNRLLPLLNLPDFINTMQYTEFEQVLFYFWSLVVAMKSGANAFTIGSVDSCLIKTYHQNSNALLFVPFFEFDTGIRLQDIEVGLTVKTSTIAELVREIAKFYWPYCYILRREGDNFIETTTGSSINVTDEVQQFDNIACLDIDWTNHTAKYTLPYFE